MNFFFIHADQRAAYAISRHLHLHSEHKVVAVVPTEAEIQPLLAQASLTECRPRLIIRCADVPGPGHLAGLPTLTLAAPASAGDVLLALDVMSGQSSRRRRASGDEFYRALYHRQMHRLMGHERAEISLLPKLDFYAAVARIEYLQGPQPRNRAAPQPGWDALGTFRLDVVRQVYAELQAVGKL